MKINWIGQNWLKLIIAAVLLAVGTSAVYYFAIFLPHELRQANSTANNFAMQTQCADAALKFFNNDGYNATSAGLNFSYDNHFNAQMNKCFILVFGNNPNDDYVSVDLYDALGGQEYANFTGYQNCDPLALAITGDKLKQTRCQMNTGDIWSNGDSTGSSTYHVGFGGLLHGGVGDENTYTQFMAYVRPFMTD